MGVLNRFRHKLIGLFDQLFDSGLWRRLQGRHIIGAGIALGVVVGGLVGMLLGRSVLQKTGDGRDRGLWRLNFVDLTEQLIGANRGAALEDDSRGMIAGGVESSAGKN